MPRSLEQILAHADEYADRFETYEPKPGDLRVPAADNMAAGLAEHMRAVAASARDLAVPLPDLVQLRAQLERIIADSVQRMRSERVPWKQIGEELGTSGEAARQRYKDLIKS